MKTVTYLTGFLLVVALIINADNLFNDGKLIESASIVTEDEAADTKVDEVSAGAEISGEESARPKKREGAYNPEPMSPLRRAELREKAEEVNRQAEERRAILESVPDLDSLKVQHEDKARIPSGANEESNPSGDT